MDTLSSWIRPHLLHVSMAIIATLLVVYGSSVNRFVRKRIRHMHFVWRLLIFVALCAFGYGLLLVFGAEGLAWVLRNISNAALFPAVVLIFLIIGFLAEQKNQM